MFKSGRDVPDHRKHALETIWRVFVQALTFDELHNDVRSPVDLARVMHGHDIGVIELGDRLCFAQQARATLSAEAGLVQDFDGHIPIQHRVVTAIDNAHAAAAEFFAELVTVVEDGRVIDFAHLMRRTTGNLASIG